MKSAGLWSSNHDPPSKGWWTCANGIETESKQTSSTSGIRRIVLRPVGSSGFGRVSASMCGRCRSVGRTPKSRSSSSREPYTSVRGYAGSSLRQTGIGLPQ